MSKLSLEKRILKAICPECYHPKPSEWHKEQIKDILSLISSREQELVEKVRGMKKNWVHNHDLWVENNIDCRACFRNQVLDDIVKLLK